MIKRLSPKSKPSGWTLVLNEEPKDLIFKANGYNEIFFNSFSQNAVCVNCSTKPCFEFTEEEINIEILGGAPRLTDKRVCPTNAIFSKDSEGITIDNNLCIGCGLCFSRCEFGAIYFKENGGVDVNVDFESDGFTTKQPYDNFTALRTEGLIKKVQWKVEIEKISSDWCNTFQSGLNSLSSKISDLEIILVRNLLIQAGIPNLASTRGNIDFRIDLLGILSSGEILSIESGLMGTDILGLSRRILDDFAVLNSRHSVTGAEQRSVGIINSFPRKRSDFYEVISDIENVTGLKIQILPLHFLLVLNLFKMPLKQQDILNYKFVINLNNMDFGQYFKSYIPEIEIIDENYGSELYTFGK